MLQLLFILFLPLISGASNFEGAVSELERQVEQMNSGYYDYISLRHESEINRHFALTSADHDALAYGLNLLAEKDLSDVQRLDNLFEIYKRDLSQAPDRANEISADIFNIYSRVYTLKQKVNLYQDDMSQLSQSWENYCSDERIEYSKEFFNPLSQYTPVDDLGYLQSPTIPFHFSINMSFSSDASIKSIQFDADNPRVSDKEDALWQTAAVSASMAAESICAFLSMGASTAALGTCAVIGSAMVYAVRFIVDSIRFSSEVRRRVRLENRQAEARRRLYNHQVSSIHRLKHEQSDKVLKACQNFFNKEKKWPQQRIEQLSARTSDLYEKMSSFIRIDLDDLLERNYEYLIEQYLPSLVNSFWTSIDHHYQDQGVIDKRVKKHTMEKIVPIMNEYSSSESIMKKAQLEQKLWTQVIMGDARFLGEKEFSFIDINEQGADNPFLGNIWNQLGVNIINDFGGRND